MQSDWLQSQSQCSLSRLRTGGHVCPAPPTERPLLLSEPSCSNLWHHTNSKMKLLFQDGTGWAFSGDLWDPEETSSFWLTVCLSVKSQSTAWCSSWRTQEALVWALPKPGDKDTASHPYSPNFCPSLNRMLLPAPGVAACLLQPASSLPCPRSEEPCVPGGLPITHQRALCSWVLCPPSLEAGSCTLQEGAP